MQIKSKIHFEIKNAGLFVCSIAFFKLQFNSCLGGKYIYNLWCVHLWWISSHLTSVNVGIQHVPHIYIWSPGVFSWVTDNIWEVCSYHMIHGPYLLLPPLIQTHSFPLFPSPFALFSSFMNISLRYWFPINPFQSGRIEADWCINTHFID